MNHFKYAISKWLSCLGAFGILIGICAIYPLPPKIAIIVICCCFAFSFIIPFVASFLVNNITIKTVGKSNVIFKFGDLFDEDCFVVTTNRYFDVDPNGEHISENSVLGKFVNKFFRGNVVQLENIIKEKLPTDENGNVIPTEYGTSIKIIVNGKTVYLLAFTDRNKSDQPEDFYIQTTQKFFIEIADENHGKTIGIPLLGANNNLSDSGFTDSEMAFRCLMAMINNFEIVNQRSELKIKRVNHFFRGIATT